METFVGTLGAAFTGEKASALSEPDAVGRVTLMVGVRTPKTAPDAGVMTVCKDGIAEW